jgi:hypothetical protein
MHGDSEHDDDDHERALMETLEHEIAALSTEHQLALQHVARSECLGVEVIMSNRLPENKGRREAVCQEARRTLSRRLVALGLM